VSAEASPGSALTAALGIPPGIATVGHRQERRGDGENLFKSVHAPDPVRMAVQGWMQSPGHRRNILLKEFTETGVGIWHKGADHYSTQLFRRPP
jgi:hypothetical protein